MMRLLLGRSVTDDCPRIHADRLTQIDELEHVQVALSGFKFRNERLGVVPFEVPSIS